MPSEEAKELESLCERLCDTIDQMENRLRVYDAAFRFFKANNEKYAPLLDDSLFLAETQPAVQQAASREHFAFVQEARILVSRMLQVISSLSTAAPKPTENS
jgi:hypothetical protein